MSENTETILKKEHAGHFKPGAEWRGNANGKPKGARHFTTLFKEAIKNIAEGQSEPDDILIVKKVIQKAKEGDLKAVDMVLDRTDGKAEQTINLDADVTMSDGLTEEQKEALLNLLK